MLRLLQWPIRAQENSKAKGEEPMRVKIKETWKRREMWENNGDENTIGLRFLSYWLRQWREFIPGPITEGGRIYIKIILDLDYFRNNGKLA